MSGPVATIDEDLTAHQALVPASEPDEPDDGVIALPAGGHKLRIVDRHQGFLEAEPVRRSVFEGVYRT